MGIGGLGGRDHVGLGGVGAAEEQVLPHGAVEEEDILQNDADLLAQALEGVIVQVAAVQGDGAVGQVVEAGDQADQGSLAHAGGSDQGHHGFGRGLQADILQDADAGGVFEVDVAEDHVALEATGDRRGARDVLGLVRLGHQVGHPVGTGEGSLDGLPGAAEVPDGGVETFEVKEEGHQVRDGQGTRQGQPPAEVNHDEGAERGGEFHKRLEGGHQFEGAELGLAVTLDACMNAGGFLGLAGEGFDLADAGEIVVQEGVQVAQHLLTVAEGRADISGVNPQRQEYQRDGDEAEEGEFPVQAKQDDGNADQGDQVDDHVGDGVGDELLEQVGVVDHVGHEVADLLILVEAQGETLHVVVNIFAHIGDHAPAGHMGHIGADEGQAGADEIGSQDDDRQEGDVVKVGQGGARVGDAGDQ